MERTRDVELAGGKEDTAYATPDGGVRQFRGLGGGGGEGATNTSGAPPRVCIDTGSATTVLRVSVSVTVKRRSVRAWRCSVQSPC